MNRSTCLHIPLAILLVVPIAFCTGSTDWVFCFGHNSGHFDIGLGAHPGCCHTPDSAKPASSTSCSHGHSNLAHSDRQLLNSVSQAHGECCPDASNRSIALPGIPVLHAPHNDIRLPALDCVRHLEDTPPQGTTSTATVSIQKTTSTGGNASCMHDTQVLPQASPRPPPQRQYLRTVILRL